MVPHMFTYQLYSPPAKGILEDAMSTSPRSQMRISYMLAISAITSTCDVTPTQARMKEQTNPSVPPLSNPEGRLALGKGQSRRGIIYSSH